MALNVTPFVGTDNFNMETFNNMISQINSGVNSEISDVLAQLGTKAEIVYSNYTGTGTFGSGKETVITFPFSPAFICICGDRYMAFFIRGVSFYRYLDLGGTGEAIVSWSEDKKTISLRASNDTTQMNTKDAVYYVVGIGEKQ